MTRIGEATDAISDAITKANADVIAVNALITSVTTKAPVVLGHIRTMAQTLGFTGKMLPKIPSSSKKEEVVSVKVEGEEITEKTRVPNSDLDIMRSLGRRVAKNDDQEAFEEAAEYLALALVEESNYSSLWFWFEEGARNNCDGMPHLEAIQRRLRKRANDLYLENQ